MNGYAKRNQAPPPPSLKVTFSPQGDGPIQSFKVQSNLGPIGAFYLAKSADELDKEFMKQLEEIEETVLKKHRCIRIPSKTGCVYVTSSGEEHFAVLSGAWPSPGLGQFGALVIMAKAASKEQATDEAKRVFEEGKRQILAGKLTLAP